MNGHKIEERYIKLDNWNVLYCVVGTGPHVLLCNVGSVCHCITQFEPIIKHGYDLDKFTLVIWDPPGYGKSRPPERDFSNEVYFENAKYAFALMKALNFSYYSVWGVCSGGATSMILAAKHPKVVRALVLSNTRSHYLPNDIKLMTSTNLHLSTLPSVKARLAIYGEENLMRQLQSCHENIKMFVEKRNGNVCSHLLADIKCPTFIVAGGKDPLVDQSHASFLNENIRGSKLYVGPEYGHNPYFKLPAEFSKMVQEFLLQH